MKKILFLIIGMLLITACEMTPVYVSDLPLNKEKVINFDNKTKSELYGSTLDFFPHFWKNSKAVIQMQDENRGRFIVKGDIGSYSSNIKIKATIQLDVKDGKARISITHMSNRTDALNAHEYGSLSQEEMIQDNQQAINSLFIEYEKFINKNISNDDW